MENTVKKSKIGKFYKLYKYDYDGFEYADFFEVIKESPKTVVLRELKGYGLSSDQSVYYAGDYLTDYQNNFYDIRKTKKRLLEKFEDISLGFTGGKFYHNR